MQLIKNKIFFIIFLILISITNFSTAHAQNELVLFWDYDPDSEYYSHFRKMLDKFEAENHVKVVLQRKRPLSTDELHDAYIKIISSGSETPDVLQLDAIRLPEFAELGLLLDVTPYFLAAEQRAFFQKALQEASWRGRFWGFPFFEGVGLITYRKDILAKNGYEEPKTWMQLVEIAQKLQDENLYGYVGQMARYEGLVCNFLEFIWSNGGTMSFEEPFNFVTPQNIEGLKLFVDIANRYKITPENQLNYKEGEGIELYMGGRALFVRQWNFSDHAMVIRIKELDEVVQNTAIMAIPPGPSGKIGVSMTGSWVLAVNKNSKNPILATKLAKYISNEENQKEMMLGWKRLPSREALYGDRELLARYPWLTVVSQAILGSRLRPRTPYYPEISRIMQEEIHLALEEKIEPILALQRIEAKVRSFLSSVGKKRGGR